MHVLGTCGHVDHGKSSLLRALTGMEPDRLPEEKKRGMTIDLGFVWLAAPDGARVGIVDVPGHQRFVKNMISGTINVDAFLFVVAADDGWMPQSQEHLDILRSLGVTDGLVVITKTDLVELERVSQVADDVAGRLHAAFGKDFPLLRFSTARAESLAPLRQSVWDLVARLPSPERGGQARLWIDRVFLPRGVGVVVTGTLREGMLREGDEVHLWPSGKAGQLKSLQAYRQTVGEAAPVSRVALGLAKLTREEVARGMLLTTAPRVCLSTVADVRARFFDRAPKGNVRVSFHVGTRRETALLIPLGDADSGEKFLRLKFARAIPLRAGDRFVLRTAGEDETIGAGTVADPQSGATTHREAKAALSVWAADPAGTVRLEARQRLVIDVEALTARSAHSRVALEGALTGDLWSAVRPGIYAEKTTWEKARHSAREEVAAAHAKKHEPVAAKDLRKAWQASGGLPGRWLEAVLELLAACGELKRQGHGYLPVTGTQGGRSGEARQKAARDWLAKAGGEPAPFKEAPAEVKRIARELVRAGEWVALGEEFFWEAEPYAEIRGKVEAHLREKGQATTSDLKTVLGRSRKIAVLILEQLDRDRVTYLKDGVRRLLKG